MPSEFQVTFPSEAAAQAARRQLTTVGIDPDTITFSQPAGREGSFLTHLVITIALWSVAGAAAGIGLGTIIWLLLGPEGETGFIIHVVVWGIFGHLIAGMWAGYLGLADRTEADLPHDRPGQAVTVTIACPDETTAAQVRELVKQSQAP